MALWGFIRPMSDRRRIGTATGTWTRTRLESGALVQRGADSVGQGSCCNAGRELDPGASRVAVEELREHGPGASDGDQAVAERREEHSGGVHFVFEGRCAVRRIGA